MLHEMRSTNLHYQQCHSLKPVLVLRKNSYRIKIKSLNPNLLRNLTLSPITLYVNDTRNLEIFPYRTKPKDNYIHIWNFIKKISLEKTLIYLRPAIGKSLEQLEFMSF